MKLVQINSTCGVGSTGKICEAVSRLLTDRNIENYILFSSNTNGYELGISCSNINYIKIQALKSRIFGNYGFNSNKATRKIIKELERINPDIVHLHNIHGHDCNIEILCEYLKRKNKKVFWTFHDCWSFTAYCPHFMLAKCDKWQEMCFDCSLHKKYSWFFDRSCSLYNKKKKAMEGMDLTIITPSKWMADIVKKSFLKDYPIKVINNAIDLNTFKPTESNFKAQYNIDEKKIVLGVSFDWDNKKGLDCFINLSETLPADYQIILVGTNDEIDKQLTQNIISIHRTNDKQELAAIYTAADVYVNPTREDTYPTVNLEAMACGTPVVTFRAGGSPEAIVENKTGYVVECDDLDAMKNRILEICSTDKELKENCIKHSKSFDDKSKYKEYLDLYDINEMEGER